MSDMSDKKRKLRKYFQNLRTHEKAKSSEKDWGPKQYETALEFLKQADIPLKEMITASYYPMKDELDINMFSQGSWIYPDNTWTVPIKWHYSGHPEKKYSIDEIISEKKDKKAARKSILVFVPALAVDRKKNRLGYGKGCYDNLLATYGEHLLTVCLVPSHKFIVDELPAELHDEKVDFIF